MHMSLITVKILIQYPENLSQGTDTVQKSKHVEEKQTDPKNLNPKVGNEKNTPKSIHIISEQ